jgi:hypothetical protein
MSNRTISNRVITRRAASRLLLASFGAAISSRAFAHDHDHMTPDGQMAQAKTGAPTATAATGVKRTPAPPDAYCYIGWPNDGETLKTRHIKVWFGTRNFGVAPAGVDKPNTGHHHLLIDTDLPPLDEEIPNDKNHLHFGAGQTETYIDLPPGTHTLQLLMGDANHVPFDPPVMSKKITIHVL